MDERLQQAAAARPDMEKTVRSAAVAFRVGTQTKTTTSSGQRMCAPLAG